MFGFLNINKPAGLTSHDVVAAIRKRLPRRTRVGHAGTLDPFATGVLVLCIGPATRLAEYVQKQPKRYLAEVTLGATSTTDDCEGEITPLRQPSARHPGSKQIARVIEGFVGDIRQVPPAHSAVHVNGERAYKLARRGDDVKLAARTVTIHNISLDSYEFPKFTIDVRCGSGTYIRALARDIGGRLGVGGYCSKLTRTEIGVFKLTDAIEIDEVSSETRLLDPLIALEGIPRVSLDTAQSHRVRNGNPIATDLSAGETALIDDQGKLLAVATVDGNLLKPSRVFQQANQS